MFLPVEGRGGDDSAGADYADGCEWRDSKVLIVFCWVFGLGVVEESGIDEVGAVDGEVDYGAIDRPCVTELAEVGVGVPRCGTACGRLELDEYLLGNWEGNSNLKEMGTMSRREWVFTFWAGSIVNVPAVACISINVKDFF